MPVKLIQLEEDLYWRLKDLAVSHRVKSLSDMVKILEKNYKKPKKK